MIRRQRATNATLAKYRNCPVDWHKADCIRMCRSHLVAMGHRGVMPLPSYRSLTGAVRALRATGFADIEALIDSMLPRIEPAAMLMGDVALLQGAEDSPFDAVTISVGGKVAGWYDGAEKMVIMRPLEVKAAWRA